MPSDPSTLTLTPTASKVTLSWASVTGADGYRVYRKPDGYGSASYSQIADVTTTSHVDQVPNYDLSDDASGPQLTAYDYKVTAYDSSSESSGIEDTATMTDITTTDITTIGLLDTTYNDGSSQTAGYTVTNPDTETATVNDASKSIHEGRLRAIEAYRDETPNT